MNSKVTSTVLALLASTALAGHARAQATGTTAPATVPSAAPATPAPPPAPPASDAGDETIVVHGVPIEENVLPTSLNTSSTYGIELNVMDTPRNSTILSAAQLQSVNIQDTRSFSYLTSSSYTDSAYGGPNVPRIRGQEGDVFYNGMRSVFTSNGYGAPLSFNSIQSINLTKGPASVIGGPGPGVGGSVDFLTKLPNDKEFTGEASVDFSTTYQRRWNVDFGGPVQDSPLSYRISYSGEQSDSYFISHYLDEHSVYGVVLYQPSADYTLQFNTEATIENYKENVGINRINQQLINNGTYLTGSVPNADISNYFTTLTLGNPVTLNPRITIDETPGTSAHAFLYNAQAIQTIALGDGVTLNNNTFFNYENRDNQAMYYYSDSAKDSFSIENRSDLQLKFDLPVGKDDYTLGNQMDIGFVEHFAHIDYVVNFTNEPVGVYDLSTNPSNWVFPTQYEYTGNAVKYVSADGRIQWGVPGRDSLNAGDSSISDTYDFALFLEHRMQITPELSLMYGGRYDLMHVDEEDPLGGLTFDDLWKYHSTAWYGDANANVSPVYQFAPWGTFYVTYDYTQSVSSASGDGGFGTYGLNDKEYLQLTSRLYEMGLKFNLLDNKLFWGSAMFEQYRFVPTGPGGTTTAKAKIAGFETEANYQPFREFYATASYSYIRTRLDTAASFYNFPAASGIYVDGAGNGAIFSDGQHFNDPGVPQHVFNFLANYRFNSGIGLRFGVQVTGPIDTTTSGYFDLPAMATEYGVGANHKGYESLVASGYLPQSVVNRNGYYQSPQIPWQYTMNAAIYYETGPYTVTLSLYNFTNQNNWESSQPYYGNDFIVRSDPFSADLSLKMKF